jgi:hypothetical protein
MATANYGFSNSVQVISWANLPPTQVIATLWGAGGGAGGNDAKRLGGNGSGGGYAQVTFTVSTGDLLYLAVGSGGGRGASSAGSASGGAAGRSYTGAVPFSTLNLSGVVRRTHPWYSSFLNTYGVWTNNTASTFDRTVTVNFPITGDYTFSVSADNYGEIYLDGTRIVSTTAGGAGNYGNVFTSQITVTAGNHTVRVFATDSRVPAAVGAVIAGEFSYGGGRGGIAGPSGTSGGGGGGGGATVLLRNTTVMAIAGGGGGGGGTGVASGTPANAPGNRGFTTSLSSGQNGQDKSGDGGGGGGGGGGWRGGQGGNTNSGDVNGAAGFYGDNYAPSWDGPGYSGYPIGINPPSYPGRPGSAGLGGSQAAGQSGAIVLEFPFETTRIKRENLSGGSIWTPVREIFVKNQNQWRQVQTAYIKQNGNWVISLAGNDSVPGASAVAGLFGSNSRAYS